MTTQENRSKNSVGIDVSKAALDAYCEATDTHKSFENSASGLKRLATWLKRRTAYRIVIEPSGGYERKALYFLIEQGLPVSLVHARSIKYFALAQGILAKTDALDSKVLARYGSLLSPPITSLPSLSRQKLSSYVHRRRQLVDQLKSEKNRLEKSQDEWVRQDIHEMIFFIEQKLMTLEIEINKLMHSDELKEPSRILKSSQGVGDTTTSTLLALLPELGQVGNPQIAKLVGVAPMNRESGNWKGQRAIQGGRSSVRQVLYMATMVATVHNPVIKAYYQRLKSMGKTGKVALIAAMRKLLMILNGKMKNFYNGLEVY